MDGATPASPAQPSKPLDDAIETLTPQQALALLRDLAPREWLRMAHAQGYTDEILQAMRDRGANLPTYGPYSTGPTPPCNSA